MRLLAIVRRYSKCANAGSAKELGNSSRGSATIGAVKKDHPRNRRPGKKKDPGNTAEVLNERNADVFKAENPNEKCTNALVPRSSLENTVAGPAKKVHISGRNGDKIVREALRMVLEAVYEPYFLVYSHGHRPGLGEHSALKEIRRWVGISWFLKFRIQSCRERKMTKNLQDELRQLVGDMRVLRMIRGSVEEGIRCRVRKSTNLGRLLCNVYLHKFDLSVAHNISLYKRGEIPCVTMKDGREASIPFKREGVRHILIAKFPEYRRLWYVRHGTQFMMGFIGTKEDASNIFYDAKFFIEKLGFNMNKRKSGSIADSMQNPASFLGFRIVCDDPEGFYSPKNKTESEWKKRMARLELIKEGDRWRRVMRKYVHAGKKTVRRAYDETCTVQMDVTKGSDLLQQVLKNLKDTIVGPEYRNIYHIMSPREILLNRRTQKIFPPEVTEAAKQLEASLKSFVDEKKKQRVAAQKPPKPQKQAKEPIVKPTMTPPEFYTPIRNIRIMLNNSMFLMRGRPTVHRYLMHKTEIEIVEEFARVANSILDYYKCSKNLDRVKRIVDYNLRFSCLRTLGARHETTAQKIKNVFTSELIVPVQDGNSIALRRPYPSSEAIEKIMQGFMARDNPAPPWKGLQVYSRAPL
ncbi:nuclear intron maturase 3, mitochondrial-like isoform X2 [Selaginella moellendorffii]|uniref:nuclear intron maturase 3, mitochondrial-like isoform X2 n=1 Tax=Selaginella moellendorffii TaxID=88036 RepID=UPI000D1CB37E|nr:nuclear intron maturase 3, mitochondrial-like isoform X2 [Selaginella moellendorffii]|eukprot:XP_024522060.1 nuclear intron maturase 3, mitochondrial-like isoform X2 [Selaginella moellendorffii]